MTTPIRYSFQDTKQVYLYSMKIKEQTRKLASGWLKTCFEVVDETDEGCSKHCFEVVDKTDEVSSKYSFEVGG
ncbi:chlorohydrolase [Streptococcus pneumoniae]|nr:chlorohydrolase [Streptococcus pneumoniae]